MVPPDDYARYCRYLVARYGARPVVYLVGADGTGEEPQVAAGGEEVHAWDAYGQPTGIHYQPHATNRAHQDADWLDFQSCQTGHDAEHIQDRVADMWRNTPAKGVLNLEPTYENTRERGRGVGWWQGHEAWSNLCAGATMGVGYGAASLWQWRLHADEPGHSDYFLVPRRRLARGPGLRGFVVRRRRRTHPARPALPRHRTRLDELAGQVVGLSVPGELVLLYRESGRLFNMTDPGLPPHLTVFDPRTGEIVEQSLLDPVPQFLPNDGGEPRLFLFTRHPIDRT